ncbi:MAG: DNA translocase FtsK [Bacteroidales bacterium]|nr:DNA translocase FtsK [Bacteroidales bacterium]
MAKKNKPNTANAGSAPQKANIRFASGLILIVLGLMLFFALLSFFITGGADRSVFDMPLIDLVFNKEIVAQNVLGKIGAWVSDMLITNGIGIMAFIVPAFLFAIGLWFLNVRPRPLGKIFFHGLLISIWGSTTLGFIFYGFSDRIYPLLGGAHGYFVSSWLISAIGVLGTVILLAFLLILYLSIYVNGVSAFISKCISKLTNHKFSLPDMSINMDEGGNLSSSKDEFVNDDNDVKVDNTINEEKNIFDEEDPVVDEDETYTPDEETRTINAQGFDIINTKKDSAPDDYSDDGIDIIKNEEEELASQNKGSLDTPYDPTLDLAHYQYPTFDLLVDYQNETSNEEEDRAELVEKKNKIVETLDNFGIKIQNITATIGPTVTLYEIVPAPGVRISKIQGLQDDIALSLAALGIRIIAPMPGKGTIGIEVPNSKPQVVSMLSMVKSKKFQESTFELPIVMGKTISNEVFMFDLTKTPHLLVAGATGMGKSVGLNAIVTSILYKKHPSQVKFVMVDPKMVEFSIYRKLEKHFMAKMESEDDVIITNVDKVKNTLNSLTVEMDDRYALLTKVDCRNIKEYNKKFINRQLNPENGHRYLPYIVVIIDEFADLIMTAGKEIETPIARIAQKARAVGIHMILATQRPSAKIITGVIKANFPTQIAFRVGTMVDSRTIIDTTGAQHLIGRGDMLVKMGSDTTRVQCALVDTDEVTKINDFIGSQQGYACSYPLPEVISEGDGMEGGGLIEPGQLDSLFSDVAHMVVEMQSGSTSNIQRRFSLGYNRAGKLMDQLERAGIVGPAEGSKPRQVLVQTDMELERILQGFGL